MSQKPPDKEPSDHDLEDFEEQPRKTRELMDLKEHAEKATGPERAKLDQDIRRRAGEG